MLKKVNKIISGGQTGADIAGLRVAKFFGLQIGGWMPQGWWTQNGPKPEYEKLYLMKECKTKGYAARTHANIRDSDGTVRFAFDWESAGELCTLGGINVHKKPHLDIDVSQITNINDSLEHLYNLQEFITKNEIRVLNIAGNSERTCPGIESVVSIFLTKFFDRPIK